MPWDRFSYICRSACAGLTDKDDVSSYLSSLDKQPSTDLYGKKFKKQLFKTHILKQVSLIKNRNEALEALTIYKDLNLAGEFEQPKQFKRTFAYLCFVFLILLLVSSLFQSLVIPTLSDVIVNSGDIMPSNVLWYQDNWFNITSLISLIFLSFLLIAFKINQIFSFELNVEKDVIFKYLLFKSIRQSYLTVQEVMLFPISRVSSNNTRVDSEVITHLKHIENSELSIAIEMQALLRIEMNTLIEKCEKQMKLVSVIIGIAVVFSILLFLSSTYSPIFLLGETL